MERNCTRCVFEAVSKLSVRTCYISMESVCFIFITFFHNLCKLINSHKTLVIEKKTKTKKKKKQIKRDNLKQPFLCMHRP